ncbi:BA75_04726T0 [Komagataella pastoris]|uniref:BA75_04726T0 n=1 Tax=Komagataella pastoris TaxID=4922 RepID=A0A1B2JHB1_PICPA|nr:BA75_04726T0 [Komagataella pastoris]
MDITRLLGDEEDQDSFMAKDISMGDYSCQSVSNVRNPDELYYLLVPSSIEQRELVEQVIKLHRSHLEDLILGIKQESKGKMEDDLTMENLTSAELLELLEDNLQLINNHPNLLVQHYIPKSLILMEPHERLVATSGKFQALDQIIFLLQDQEKHIVIVASQSKELDLVEGTMLGKQINYHRYSGGSLYDQFVKSHENVNRPQHRHHYHQTIQFSNNRSDDSSTPTYSAVNNKKKNNKKKGLKDDYEPRISKNNPLLAQLNKDYPVNFHLITSNQLKNFRFPENANLDMIISLDPYLDIKSDYITEVRTINTLPSDTVNNLIPVFKLVTVNSVEHAILASNVHNSKQAVFDMLFCRNDEFDADEMFKNLKKLQPWLHSPLRTQFPLPLKIPKLRSASSSEQLLKSLEPVEYLQVHGSKSAGDANDIPPIPKHLTYQNYAETLAALVRFINDRALALIEEAQKKIDEVNLKETVRQAEIEQSNIDIGERYKLLKDLQDKAEAAERRAIRTEQEAHQWQESAEELQEQLDTMKKVISGENTARKDIGKVEQELKDLEEEVKQLEKSNEELRLQYQEKSTVASEKSFQVAALEKNQKELKEKHDRPILELVDTAREAEKTKLREQVDQLRRETEFNATYIEKLESILRQKDSTLPSYVSRSTRMSRSATPNLKTL